ncbi:MAG: ATP-binding cassette domain-containing protein, partial [Victivallales bacterium]|nr:ATP-binding cassette domain-containing protein [Victivallales bacterium]
MEIGVRRGGRLEPAVSGVSFELRRGEMLALLGESGSGKSLTALSLMDLLPAPAVERMAGTAYFNGVNLFELDEEEYRRLRGDRIAMIFQEPMTA